MLNNLFINKKFYGVMILVLAFSQAFAQYELKRNTINSGGGIMSGSVYQLNASIGQTGASNSQTGANYSFNGGFWHKTDTTPQPELIFTNGFE